MQPVDGGHAIFAPKIKNPKGTLADKLPPRLQRETGEFYVTTLAEFVTMVTSFEVNVFHENESREFSLQLFFVILREHSFFRRGRVARGITMSMNVKSPSPPFIFFVKKCNHPPGSSKI